MPALLEVDVGPDSFEGAAASLEAAGVENPGEVVIGGKNVGRDQASVIHDVGSIAARKYAYLVRDRARARNLEQAPSVGEAQLTPLVVRSEVPTASIAVEGPAAVIKGAHGPVGRPDYWGTVQQ